VVAGRWRNFSRVPRLPAFRTCLAIPPWRGFCGSRYSRVRVGHGFTTVRQYDICHCPKPLRGAEICQKRCGNSFQPTPAFRCIGRTILKTGYSHFHFAVKCARIVLLLSSSSPGGIENVAGIRGSGRTTGAPKLTQWRLSEVGLVWAAEKGAGRESAHVPHRIRARLCWRGDSGIAEAEVPAVSLAPERQACIVERIDVAGSIVRVIAARSVLANLAMSAAHAPVAMLELRGEHPARAGAVARLVGYGIAPVVPPLEVGQKWDRSGCDAVQPRTWPRVPVGQYPGSFRQR
jgi:hypothetical protein